MSGGSAFRPHEGIGVICPGRFQLPAAIWQCSFSVVQFVCYLPEPRRGEGRGNSSNFLMHDLIRSHNAWRMKSSSRR